MGNNFSRTTTKQIFHFTPISEIENMKSNSMVDIISVVLSIDLTNIIFKKDATRIEKINLQLKDMSTSMAELTMWGGFCDKEGQQLQEMCSLGTFPILAIKVARVSDFGGKSMGTITTTQLLINLDLPESTN